MLLFSVTEIIIHMPNTLKGEFFMETIQQTKNEITEGIIWKQLLLFFFPILLGTFFSSFIIRSTV